MRISAYLFAASILFRLESVLCRQKERLHEKHFQLPVRFKRLREYAFEILFVFLCLNMIFALKEAVVRADEQAQNIRLYIERILAPAAEQSARRVAGNASVYKFQSGIRIFRAEHTADNKCVAVPYLMVEIMAAFGLFVSVAVRYRIALKKYLHIYPQSMSAKTMSVISPRQVPLLRSTSRASNAGSSSCGILIFTVTASSNAVSSTMPPCSGISEASRP